MGIFYKLENYNMNTNLTLDTKSYTTSSHHDIIIEIVEKPNTLNILNTPNMAKYIPPHKRYRVVKN
jgi:hypothetical protein